MTYLLILGAIAFAFVIGFLAEASDEWDRILERLLPEARRDQPARPTRLSDFSAVHERLDQAARERNQQKRPASHDGGDAA